MFCENSLRMQNEIVLSTDLKLNGYLYLERWFEAEKQELASLTVENMSIQIWFDESCLTHPYSSKELNEATDVALNQLRARLKIADVSNELIEHVLDESSWQHPADSAHHEYYEIGLGSYTLLYETANRLLSWIRTRKGQYWLEEFRLHGSKSFTTAPGGYVFSSIYAEANGKPFYWHPPSDITPHFIPIGERSVSEADWTETWKFIHTKERPDLVLELLADSELLALMGHSRVALTQAVSALEVSLNRFASSPNTKLLWTEPLRSRVEVSSLQNEIKRLGFSETFFLLLPLIFTEDDVPTALLKDCQAAIQQRNNVIHRGTRSITNVEDSISSIRQMCRLLQEYSQKNIESDP